ncbi:MAG: hypothetical protein V3T84_11165 [Phycisphaerales bacterium]
MELRAYDESRDKDAVCRIWREAGWMEGDKTEAFDAHRAASRGLVALIDGEAECLVLTSPGTVRYLDEDLSWSCVSAVVTSRVARKQAFASRLSAQAIANDVAQGAIVSGLGMFEQGYYDRLGFGTGSYVHRVAFDPSRLRVDGATRVPCRLTVDDYKIIHANRLNRDLPHGAVTLAPPGFTKADILQGKECDFGLGFADGPNGELTHHLWMYTRGKVESGPYCVGWMAWKTREQFLELMGLLKNLGDQVRLIFVRETHGIQLQDLIDKPMQHRQMTTDSDFDSRMRVVAYWQMRICDVPKVLEQTHLRGDELRFNLKLTDPIERYLSDDGPWLGIGGDYVVTLGPSSGAASGSDGTLPTLTASVGAFTRLWLGVRPATALHITDELDGPRELLEELDWTLRLPAPETGWDF